MINKIVDDIDIKYSTLGRDIGIYRRDKGEKQHQYHNKPNDNLDGKWDRIIEKGDFKQVKGDKSVYNAITLSILTAYKELENKGIKTYKNFGNKSYTLIKENKNRLTLFKLQSYFIETIEKIRRINEVVELVINEFDIYSFDINFTVTTIEDTIIKGQIYYNNNKTKSYCFIEINLTPEDYIRPNGILKANIKLVNNRQNGIPNKLIRFYLDDELYSYDTTNEDGEVNFYIKNITETKIYKLKFIFEGDTDFHQVESEIANVFSSQYRFDTFNDNLNLEYNQDAIIPVFKLENGILYIDEESTNKEHKINEDKIYINI